MHVKLLGTAAGGALPQWNCACGNCRALRDGTFRGKARTQLQVAVSVDSQTWFLLNASPDIRFQIEADPDFQPRRATRETPIAGVVLTSGDLDQVLGLLLLREFQQFQIYATASLRELLREDNSVFSVLNRIPDQAVWNDIVPANTFSLSSNGQSPGLRCTPVSVGEHLPSYASPERRGKIRAGEALLGLLLQSQGGGTLGYFPAVPQLTPALLRTMAEADVLLVDGTFWSEEELRSVRGSGPTSRQIGHVPVEGETGSLRMMSAIKARKIYIHMNNTNPMLDESGDEYRQVREAGWEIAEDGWEFEL